MLVSCSSNNTNNSFADDFLPILGLGAIGYLTYEASKSSGSYYTAPTDSGPSIETCQRGYFQGCCSHHGGLLGCLNYRVVCQDQTISTSWTCFQKKCVFDW